MRETPQSSPGVSIQKPDAPSPDAPATAADEAAQRPAPSLGAALIYMTVSAMALGLPSLFGILLNMEGLPPGSESALAALANNTASSLTESASSLVSSAAYLLGIGFGVKGALALKEAHDAEVEAQNALPERAPAPSEPLSEAAPAVAARKPRG